jgi:hypothetical protein
VSEVLIKKEDDLTGARYETVLAIEYDPTSPNPIDPRSYIEFNKRFSYFPTEFQAPELYIDARNKGTKPTTDVIFDYEVENIEYEDLNNTAREEIGLLNYYEPFQNAWDLKNKASVFLQSSLDEYNTGHNKRYEYKNLIVPSENVKNIADANLGFPDGNTPQEVVQTRGFQKFGTTGGLTFSQQIPFVSRIRMENLNSILSVVYGGPLLWNNVLFFLPENSERTGATDLGTNLLRWHSEYSEYFTKLRTHIYSRNLDQSDGTTVSANIKQPIVSYDFVDWLNNYAPSNMAHLSNTTKMMSASPDPSPSVDLAVSNYNVQVQLVSTMQAAADKYLSDLISYAGVKKINNVLVGEAARSEVLYYKIEKYEGNSTNGSPIQTIFVPNTAGTLSDVEYLDTQVFYDKEYTYKVFYVFAIYGCEYEYRDILPPEENESVYRITVDSYPRVRIVEFPAFEKTGRILAKQPLTPDFELVPIRRRKNRFKLIFKTNYGHGEEVPTSLTRADEQDVFAAKANEYWPIDDKIGYSSVSTVTGFEIYKSDEQPLDITTYDEFNEKLYASISTDVDPNSKLLADSAAAVLSLIPDQKYYFTFIARNRLGVASNPTKIFEIQLIDSDGLSYPVIKEVTDDRKKDTRKNSKTLTKVVTIRPEVNHTQVDYSKSDFAASSKGKPVVLGVKEDGLFGSSGAPLSDSSIGKKFKFRFRSKLTNRAFDINVTCKTERVATIFDKETPAPNIVQPIPDGRDIPIWSQTDHDPSALKGSSTPLVSPGKSVDIDPTESAPSQTPTFVGYGEPPTADLGDDFGPRDREEEITPPWPRI